MHILGGASEQAHVVETREADHRDRTLAGITREQCGARRCVGELRARLVEALADREHRRLHVGAPRESCGGDRLAVAAHAAQFDYARRCCDRRFDGFRDEARYLLGGGTGVDGADGEHRQRHVGEQRDR